MCLSGGQKQRIAFARAILRNAPIFILDEATSAVDNETEYEIQKSILQINQQSTIIIVAHRLSTIKLAHEIFYLHDGSIVEHGTHDELLANKSFYFNLYGNVEN
jgi:ABC-type multidrug transport system fused ATPase/permease subunit